MNTSIVAYILLSGGGLIAIVQTFNFLKKRIPKSVESKVFNPADFIGCISDLIGQTDSEECREHLRKAGQTYVANLGKSQKQ